LVSAELLLTRNDNGDTPIHAAAFAGHLNQIPAELLTADRLSCRNYERVTALQTAIDRGFADQLPEQFRPKPETAMHRLLRRIGGARLPFSR
jgi:ankyrin repeat protein